MLLFSRTWMLALAAVLMLLALPACNENEDGASDDDTAPADDDSAPATDDDDTTADDDGEELMGTRYPIVLVHGFFGWGENDMLSYFFGVADDLRARGYEVFTTRVSPVNSMKARAEGLALEINAKYPGQKINVIAHSQGGLDVRYLISTMGWGDRVAALVMVATPNRGTALADVVAGLIPGFLQPWIDHIMNLLHMDFDGFTELTRDYVVNTFNPANPDDPRVAYFSYPTDARDFIYPLLIPTHALLTQLEGPNDGVVGSESAEWGEVKDTQYADHWAVIGQPAGYGPYDHLAFYREVADFLRDEGF